MLLQHRLGGCDNSSTDTGVQPNQLCKSKSNNQMEQNEIKDDENIIKENYAQKKENNDKKEEDIEDSEDKEDTLRIKFDEEKEKKRRKILNQIQSDSKHSTINKDNNNIEEKNKKVEKDEIKEEEIDENKKRHKGAYIFTTHRNKLTIDIKQKDV